MTQPLHRKFEFGTVFGDNGHVVREAAREKRSYTPDEVEAIRQQAFAEGEASAIARAQIANAAALSALAQNAGEGLGALQAVVQAYKQACVDLSLLCARKIAAEALDQFPAAPVEAALAALAQEIEGASRLVLFSRAPSEEMKAAAQDAAVMSGFAGQIVFRDDPRLPAGAFELVWPEGRAEFNPDTVAEVIDKALSEALEAEVYHNSLQHSQAARAAGIRS